MCPARRSPFCVRMTHVSKLYNPDIARVFYRAEYIEGQGDNRA